MRRYDVAYVKNPPHYTYPKDYKEMTLPELKKQYIDSCAKSKGLITTCKKCENKCIYGLEAIKMMEQSLQRQQENIPLYDGKTLMEKAKVENMLRRMQNEQKTKKDRLYINKWYEKAVASGNATKWVMEQYDMSEHQARHKIYNWRYNHKPKKEKIIATPKTEEISNTIETKLEVLMKEQEAQKKTMNEYQKKYEEAKQLFEEINKKIDVLCRAMDIVNE